MVTVTTGGVCPWKAEQYMGSSITVDYRKWNEESHKVQHYNLSWTVKYEIRRKKNMIEHHHYILNVMCVMQCNIINVLHTEHNNGPVCYCCWVKIQKKKKWSETNNTSNVDQKIQFLHDCGLYTSHSRSGICKLNCVRSNERSLAGKMSFSPNVVILWFHWCKQQLFGNKQTIKCHDQVLTLRIICI